MAVQDMQRNEMMSHLTSALDRGEDIGHYGRLVFAMVARHFLPEDELVALLARNPGFDDVQARALVKQVQARDYNPPKREKIMQFQREQEFPICPGNDLDGCNVYKNLAFPQEVFDKINAYYERRAQA